MNAIAMPAAVGTAAGVTMSDDDRQLLDAHGRWAALAQERDRLKIMRSDIEGDCLNKKMSAEAIEAFPEYAEAVDREDAVEERIAEVLCEIDGIPINSMTAVAVRLDLMLDQETPPLFLDEWHKTNYDLVTLLLAMRRVVPGVNLFSRAYMNPPGVWERLCAEDDREREQRIARRAS